ncbi:MAG: protease family protein [Solirubrobacteraceae bacterium]|nr:protease family protein [Solirubrobacteraceae bacterium]
MTSVPPPGYAVPPDAPQPSPSPPAQVAAARGRDAWAPWTAPVALVTWFGITIFGGLGIALVGAATGSSLQHPPPGVNIAATFLQDVAMIATALLFAHIAGRPRPEDFGLRRPPIGRAIRAIIAVWVGFFVTSLVWSAAIGLNDPQTLPDDLGLHDSTLNLVLVVVLVTVVAPLAEEMLFRGYLFPTLRNWSGVLPAAILTGLLFGAVHIGSSPIGYALPLAAFGFGLCLLYHVTGSLYPGIALHAMNNAIALGVNQHWGWQIAPILVGAVLVTLTLASQLGRALGGRADRAAGPRPQPAT